MEVDRVYPVLCDKFDFCWNWWCKNIKQVNTVKYLGVTFDSNLTWTNHIDELCLKLSKAVGLFSKLRYRVNSDILPMLYYSLFYPFLTYGIQVWGLTYTNYLNPLIWPPYKSEPASLSEPLLKISQSFKIVCYFSPWNSFCCLSVFW